MHLQAFVIFSGLALRAQAAITVHYFNQASCNANTAQDVYSNAVPAAENTGCMVIGIAGISAIYVDGIDDGCTIRTYSDTFCNDNLGLPITAGTCYFKDPSTIGSWRATCGSSASSSSDSVVTISLTSISSTVGSDTASTPESSTTTIDTSMTSMTMEAGPVLTSVETVGPSMTQEEVTLPTDSTPMATQMPTAGGNGSGAGNGTNWNMTHSKLSPTGSPGLQGSGVGSGMGTSGVGEGRSWSRGLLKALSVFGLIAGWQGYLF